MTAAPISLTQSNLQTVQRSFLLSILDPAVQVVEGRQNRVAQPYGSDYVVMLKARRSRLATNVDTWTPAMGQANLLNVSTPMRATTQFDVYGPNSADNAQRIASLWRDEIAVDFFANTGFALAPLDADEPRYLEFVDAQEQYEDRWTIDAHAEGIFVLEVPQQFADHVVINIIEADGGTPW